MKTVKAVAAKPSPMMLSLLNFMGLGFVTGITSALFLAVLVLLIAAVGQG